MSTFVAVGNAVQPFDRLLLSVAAVTQMLPRPIVVQRGTSEIIHSDWDVHQSLPKDLFEALVRDAHVLITHAGAGSIIHAVNVGKKAIIMPRRADRGEHVDDHQMELAEVLAEAGLVVKVTDERELRHALESHLSGSLTVVRSGKSKLVEAIAQLLGKYGQENNA